MALKYNFELATGNGMNDTHNFEFAPSASGSNPTDLGETSVLISIVHGPSCVSSTLNVCRARAGMRTG
jgi:hypothetical protein